MVTTEKQFLPIIMEPMISPLKPIMFMRFMLAVRSWDSMVVSS